MESSIKLRGATAVVGKDSFPVKDMNGITRATVWLEEGPKRWHVADYVYAPDKPNDHAQISIEDFRNEDEARKVFDFRKKAEAELQETARKKRARG